jgi:predicted DNA-binding protein
MRKGKTKAISIALPIETAEKLFVIASKDQRSLSSYVRLLLVDNVESYEKENGKVKMFENLEEPEAKADKPKLVSRLRKKID